MAPSMDFTSDATARANYQRTLSPNPNITGAQDAI
jgi:hypothetical protein